LGSHNLHLKLQKYDNEGAQRLNPGDSHRISRALEVVLATGTPLAEHHARDKDEPYLSGQNLEKILILPERARLIDRINERAEMMLEGGAIEEVESLLALALPPDATVLKAIGVPQISSYIIDSIDKNELCSNLQAATRQYAKRQSTWFRNQFEESWRRIG